MKFGEKSGFLKQFFRFFRKSSNWKLYW